MKKTLTTAQRAMHIIWDVVRQSGVVISGNVYKLSRPINSKKEDIVIIPLAMTADQMQRGIINVNVHVPNLDLPGDQTQPNNPRLQEISSYVMSKLDDYYGFGYNFALDNAGEPARDQTGWYTNIRVEFNAFRKDTDDEQPDIFDPLESIEDGTDY